MEKIINQGTRGGMVKLQSFAMKQVKAGYGEETELDEVHKGSKGVKQLIDPKKEIMVVKKNKVVVIDKKDQDEYLKQGWTIAEETELDETFWKVNIPDMPPIFVEAGSAGQIKQDMRKKLKGDVFKELEIERVSKTEMIKKYREMAKGEVDEEAELDEGRMKELYGYIEAGKSAEWIAKKMGVDVKTIKTLMSEAYELGTDEYREYIEKLTPGEVDEASARADAMKAMRKGKEVDPADVDIDASPEDIKGASKNIIMQMRKVVSMRGNFVVEFGDGKKVKLPVKVAQAVQAKYDSLRKPADKEKFQAQVAKSYKDMLRVLKAGYNEEVELDEGKFQVKITAWASKMGKIIVKDFNSLDDAKKHLANMEKKGLRGLISKDGKLIDSSPVKEEVDIDEEKFDYTLVAIKNKKVVAQLHSISKSELKAAIKLFKKISPDAKISIEDKGGKIVHTEEVDLDEKFTKKDYDKNEDRNMHSENAVELARKFGSTKEYNRMVAIYKAHMKLGHITSSDQKERDKLVNKYYPKLESVMRKETILERIDKKLKEKKEILEVSNRWELAGKKFSLVNDKGTFILVPQGRAGKEQKLKAKTTQDATQELVKKGYRES